jgi:hypothetical protein
MSITAIRFRAAEAGVILQVLETKERGLYESRDSAEWRDAKVEDLLEVARYTRAYDALDGLISGLQNSVSSMQDQVHRALDREGTAPPAFDKFPDKFRG